MTKKEKLLLFKFLDYFCKQLTKQNCNDFDQTLWEDWTHKQKLSFVKQYYTFNGNPQEFDKNSTLLMDFEVFSLLLDKLKKQLHNPH